MTYRVIFCGSRDWRTSIDRYREPITETMVGLMIAHPHLVVLVGGAPGADELAFAVANDLGIETEVFPADWNKYGKGAGPLRNLEMLKSGADRIEAFSMFDPIQGGTKDMVQRGRVKGLPIGICYRRLDPFMFTTVREGVPTSLLDDDPNLDEVALPPRTNVMTFATHPTPGDVAFIPNGHMVYVIDENKVYLVKDNELVSGAELPN